MVRYLRMFYVGWIGIIVGSIVLQLYLAGYGVFGFNGLKDFGAHLLVGDLIGLAILLGVALAFAARMPWRVTIINIVLVALMLVQTVLAHTGVQALSALHVVNGVLILLVTLFLTWVSARFTWPALDLAGSKAPHA